MNNPTQISQNNTNSIQILPLHSNLRGQERPLSFKDAQAHSDAASNQRMFFIDLNDKASPIKQPEKFCDNSICTSKYNIFNFIPLTVIKQYKHALHWFYLIICVVSLIPQISDIHAFSVLVPTIVVLFISMLREGIEDFRIHRLNSKTNNKRTKIYKCGEGFVEDKMMNVHVGNVVRVDRKKLIPADLLIIKSSNENGRCYMSTMNLDGEDNLKPRDSLNIANDNIVKDDGFMDEKGRNYNVETTNHNINNTEIRVKSNSTGYEESIRKFFSNNDCYIKLEKPSKDLSHCDGVFYYNGEKNKFNIKNILLRGARLMNVDYIIGVVLYTGMDTRLMKNINKSSMKFSNIDLKLNKIVVIIVILCIIISFVVSVPGFVFRDQNMPNYEENQGGALYLYYYRPGNGTDKSLERIRTLVGNFLIFSSLMPISIVIASAFLKATQTIILEFFSSVYTQNGDKITCYSTTLMDELGMVKYIFSDKTGTLTRNELEFRSCSIYTMLFDENEAYNGSLPPGFDPSLTLKRLSTLEHSRLSKNFNVNAFAALLAQKFSPDAEIFNTPGCPFRSFLEVLHHFFLGIALNHDVLREKTKSGKFVLNGANSDETTIVSAADSFGYNFLSSENNEIKVGQPDFRGGKLEKTYKILQKFDFTSERKRSSIIVQDTSDGAVYLYLKGSDDKVLESIDDFSKKYVRPATKQHNQIFATKKLRTLCFAYKSISQADYDQWEPEYKKMVSENFGQNKELEQKIDAKITEIEKNCVLLGVTALEDKLQEDVKKDIQDFINAGINFWMITGDQLSTAESIGYSCNIIDDDTKVLRIREVKKEDNIFKSGAYTEEEKARMREEAEKKVDEKLLARLKELKRIVDKMHGMGSKTDELKEQLKGKTQDIPLKRSISYIKEVKAHQTKSTNVNDTFTKRSELLMNSMNKLELTDSPNKEAFMSSNVALAPGINQNTNNYVYNNYNINVINIDMSSSSKNKSSDIKSDTESSNSILQYVLKYIGEESEYFPSRRNSLNNLDQSKKEQYIIIEKERTNADKDALIKQQKIKKIMNMSELNGRYEYLQAQLLEKEKEINDRFCLYQIPYLYPSKESDETETTLESKSKRKITLVVQGTSISKCIQNPELADLFYYIVSKSRSVICCRASPSQKSEVVKFMKERCKQITLAIGDGGNDVNMIKEANVGVGLFGKEGNQAAEASDFAVSKFKYLKHLIFIDGRFCLMRNAYFNYIYFFKNCVYIIIQFYFAFFCGFSGQEVYDDWFSMSFNMFIAVLPSTIKTAFDEDYDVNFSKHNDGVKKELKTLYPEIFKEFRSREPFNLVKFCVVLFFGFGFAAVLFYIGYYCLEDMIKDGNGYTMTYWDFSLIQFMAVVLSHYYHIFNDTDFFSLPVIAVYILQVMILIGFIFLYHALKFDDGYRNSLLFMLSNVNFYLVVLILIAFVTVPYYIYHRFEFFFGQFIVPMIHQNNYGRFYFYKSYSLEIEKLNKYKRKVKKIQGVKNGKKDEDEIYDEKDEAMIKGYLKEKEKKISKNNSGSINLNVYKHPPRNRNTYYGNVNNNMVYNQNSQYNQFNQYNQYNNQFYPYKNNYYGQNVNNYYPYAPYYYQN